MELLLFSLGVTQTTASPWTAISPGFTRSFVVQMEYRTVSAFTWTEPTTIRLYKALQRRISTCHFKSVNRNSCWERKYSNDRSNRNEWCWKNRFKFSPSLTDTYDQSAVTSNLRRRIRSRDSFTRIKQLSGRNTSSMYSEIWRKPSRNSLIHLKTRHNTQTYCLLVYRMWTFSKLVLVTCSKLL